LSTFTGRCSLARSLPGVAVRPADRQLPQRMRLPLAAGSFGGAAPLLLPCLRPSDCLVRQRPAAQLRVARRPLPALQGGHFRTVSGRRAADRSKENTSEIQSL